MNIQDQLFDETYHRAFDAVSVYTAETLVRLIASRAGEAPFRTGLTEQELVRKLGVNADYRPALTWALQFLEHQGFAERDRETYILASIRPSVGSHAELDHCSLSLAPSYRLIDWVAQHWLDIVSGRVKAVTVLFGAAGTSLWRDYFSGGHGLYDVHNQWLAITASDQWDVDGAEVLEVGAGFGSALESFMRHALSRSRRIASYTATDVSAFMLRHIRDKQAAADGLLDGVKTGLLDMNSPLLQQGYLRASCDLIVAVNSLHCATDPLFSLGELRKTLRSGGKIYISECIRSCASPVLHQEFIFNLLPGYLRQANVDSFGSSGGFLTAEAWERLLREAGFGNVRVTVNSGRRLGALITGEA